MFPIRMRAESGTCNVCSAPCSSCMHYGRSFTAMGSNSESGFSSNMRFSRMADSSFSNADGNSIPKSIICTDLQDSETSILMSTSSSHDSYSENAESKTNLRASVTCDASDIVGKHQVLSSSEVVEEECSVLRNPSQECTISHVPSIDDLSHNFHSGQGEVQSGFECHQENILLTCGDRYTNGASCYQKSCSLPSNTENKTTLFLKDESKDMEGTLNLQCKEEAVNCAEVDICESPLASLATRSSFEYRTNALTNCEASLLSQTRTVFSSCNSKTDDLCHEARKGTDSDKQFDSNSVESDVRDLEIDSAVLDVSRGHADNLQPQLMSDGGQSDVDAVLDDVKVCDICGDAGREDLLATCSRCNDGAEHTYCMREKMDKVPEGHWLCEECKIKDMESQDMDEPEAASGRLKSTSCDENIHKSMSAFIPQKLPNLECKPTYLNSRGLTKGMRSPSIPRRRQVDNMVEGNASEASDSIDKVSPRKKPTFSRQVSLKGHDSVKVKRVKTEPSSQVHSAKDSEAVPISKTYLRSNSFKDQRNLHSPHGNLSRSVSFSNVNIKPNVKRFTEIEIHKQKFTRDSTINDLTKPGLVKSMSKTSSFRCANLDLSSTDSASKSPFNSPRLEEIKRPKELQERNNVEKRCFSAVGNSFFRPSTAIAGIYPRNVDSKSMQSDFKINNVSKAGARCLGKRSDDKNDLGVDEGKTQVSFSSKVVGSSSGNSRLGNPKKPKVLKEGTRTSIMDGSWCKADSAAHNTLASLPVFGHIRMRDSTTVINSDDNQTLLCRNCNCTGHTTQNCTIDRLEGSCELEAEGNLIEVVKKRNKWRELVDAASALKKKRPAKIEELPSYKFVEMMSEGSSIYTPTACQTNVPLVVTSNKAIDSSKDSDVLPFKLFVASGSDQPILFPFEASSVAKPDGLSEIATATPLSVKNFAETMQGVLVKQSSPSAVPKLECIWQGDFNVHGTGTTPEVFNGLQAHISASASHRVSEVAAKIPCNFQLEEVSHTSLWPLQFQGISPKEVNIALFFFAKDIQSYDRCYKELVERMLRNDSALRGYIDETELLIFTSSKLPMKSRRWNNMHYLWGMFRVKRRYSLPKMVIQQKPSLSNSNVEPRSQGLPMGHVKSVPSGINNSETSSKLSELASLSVIPGESADGMDDLSYTASNIGDKKCRASRPSLVSNWLNQLTDNTKVTEEQLSFPVGNSSGTKAQPQRVSVPRCEVKSDGIYQNKTATDCMPWKTGAIEEKETSPSDRFSCESSAGRKRRRSSSPAAEESNKTCSSKVHPICSTISTPQKQEFSCSEPATTMTDPRAEEMCFFPMDVSNVGGEIVVPPSSDDEDGTESSTLDLELALGKKMKMTKPSLSTYPGFLGNDGGDPSSSSSLSLSLSFRPAPVDTAAVLRLGGFSKS